MCIQKKIKLSLVLIAFSAMAAYQQRVLINCLTIVDLQVRILEVRVCEGVGVSVGVELGIDVEVWGRFWSNGRC